ncbi:MAG: hypothetical protein V4727_00970 [Verrucomicrobiota bacterium]
MFRLLPWRFFVKRAARHYGVLDPATLLAKLRRFAQPSEVAEPLELLRAGIVFHARGLVNAKVIQHNLDWVWPYWVERQFNPNDASFVPRAFSFSHINLTHRNWTAVGLPDLAVYPIIDPRGLVTPLHDGWSIDYWIITDQGKKLLPSKLPDDSVAQVLSFEASHLKVSTRSVKGGMELESATWMDSPPVLQTIVNAVSEESGWLAVVIRPYNPEGIQFIHKIERQTSGREFRVGDEATVSFSDPPDSTRMAGYAEGDVYLDLPGRDPRREISCEVGLATAAALFRMEAGIPRNLSVSVSLERDLKEAGAAGGTSRTWWDAVKDLARLEIADGKMAFLYDAAVRTLLLLSADNMVPGPYTYRRFWFRDACLMLHPLMLIGNTARASRIIRTFPSRQTSAGYFLSQEGEWDSNGQVLWILARHAELTDGDLGNAMEESMRKAVAWLGKKRLGADGPLGTVGLLPAGFSAEHLGPNDHYYWDDFWAWAGLDAAAKYWRRKGAHDDSAIASDLAMQFQNSIESSISSIPLSRTKRGIPAAPGRRMDAGAIGSMVADYPLRLYPPSDPKIIRTADFLMERCFSQGGFFQEMIHSGVNAYLTLDLAQTLLRANDDRFMKLIRRVAELASPTGQWPEAIHPRTLGGCMGDGQHGWAAAEWIMMIRNCFVREEGDGLIIGSGILPEWIEGGPAKFGPTLTPWGDVSVVLENHHLTIDANWKAEAPRLEIRVPGYIPISPEVAGSSYKLQKS